MRRPSSTSTRPSRSPKITFQSTSSCEPSSMPAASSHIKCSYSGNTNQQSATSPFVSTWMRVMRRPTSSEPSATSCMAIRLKPSPTYKPTSPCSPMIHSFTCGPATSYSPMRPSRTPSRPTHMLPISPAIHNCCSCERNATS